MPRPDRLAKQLVAASLELHRRRTWTRVPADAPFLIRVPGEEEPLAACLIGQDGEELGLVVVRGPNALGWMRRAFIEGTSVDAGMDACDFSMVSFERFEAIPDEVRGVLKAAGFQTRRENIAPMLCSKPPHRQMRRLNRGEMRTLVSCLEGIFAAEDRGELRPARYEAGGPARKVLELAVEGKPGAARVTTRFTMPPREETVSDVGPVLLPASLRELPRTGESWIAGMVPVPGRVEGDPRTLYAVLILDEESELVVATNVVPGTEMAEAVSVLTDTMRERGLPQQVTFTSEALMDAAASGLAAIDVRSALDGDEPRWNGVAAELVEALEDTLDRRDPGPVEPRTLADWKEADQRFTQDFVGDVQERGLLTPRAAKRYFTSEEEAARVQAELEQLAVVPAFIEWFAADYRPTKRSRTYVEKRLERKGLDATERALLEARRDAYLSFFRVVSCEPGASLEVEDLLSERRFTVHDRSLSSAGLEGWCLPLRLLWIGEWFFPSVAGPPFNAFRIDQVLSQLEAAGATLEPEALRADAHLVGRTWSWFLEERETPLELQNTDGDPLEWHTAEFHVADPAAFACALEGRDDVIVDEPGAEWTWVRGGGPAGVGDSTSLCRLELFDDSLLAEVNSARRLEAARAWLEQLPGVRFTSAQRSDWDVEDGGNEPLDDRLPGPPPAPLPPEVRAEIERFMEESALGWLDEPSPALGDLTPRAACATEEGRRRVARLIRTLPAMQVPGGEIPAPRERLRRELGL